MRSIKLLCLTALLSAFSSYCLSQSIADLQLDNKQSILNGKAFFQFPREAVNSARPTDIMSADHNTNEETRIMLDIDKMRLVFFAQELYGISGKDLFSIVSNDNGSDFKSKLLSDSDSIISVLKTPLQFDSIKNAILINSLVVKTQDNSVFRISAYINPEGFKKKTEFQSLSERVFASLSKGTRILNYKARTESFPIFEGKKKFSIQLPEGFVVAKDKKYDFEVLKFKKLNIIGDTNWLSLIIYLGNHPSYFYGEYGFDQAKAEKIGGHFLNKEVKWLYFKNDKERFFLKEQQIPCGNIEQGLIVHIAMMGNQPSTLIELTQLIEKIKLVEN